MAEPDTKELDALLDSLNGSAQRFQTLWFSFLGLTLYLAITAAMTTHRMLLLGEVQTLPIIQMKVDLLTFYVLAPLFYLFVHFYLLVTLVLLARTAGAFEQQLRKTLLEDADREFYRARLDNAPVLQMLVGSRSVNYKRLPLASIAFVTVVLAPLATLIVIQLMFLPYQSFRITWWHRTLVFADLALVIVAWRRVSLFPRRVSWSLLKPSAIMGARLRTLAALAVVFWFSVWEGRWAGETYIGRANLAATDHGIVAGLFTDRLSLGDRAIAGKNRLEEIRRDISSRGEFVKTPIFDDRNLLAANLSGVDLRGASLVRAHLKAASLGGARLEFADLSGAELQGADLFYARLQGADLSGARLDGADLSGASLQGADLGSARLPGARLNSADLRGARLRGAELQGADLGRAQLQGANLSRARLQGAIHTYADASGTDFTDAQLQGADIRKLNAPDSLFQGTFVYRTAVESPISEGRAIRSVRTERTMAVDSAWEPIQCLTKDDLNSWISAATAFAKSDDRLLIFLRFTRLLSEPDPRLPDWNPTKSELLRWDETDKSNWAAAEAAYIKADPDGKIYRRRLAALLGDLVCTEDDSPFVALALASDGYDHITELLGEEFESVRERMRIARRNTNGANAMARAISALTVTQTCPGAAGLSEAAWREVEKLDLRNPTYYPLSTKPCQ